MTHPPDTREAPTEAPSTGVKEPWGEAWEQWWTSDRLDSFGWAALFLWGALVVVATYTDFRSDYDWWDGWGVFFVGAGVIVLVEASIRIVTPGYRSKWGWTLFWGSAFLAIGLGGLGHNAWYALPLVVIAIVILKDVFTRSA